MTIITRHFEFDLFVNHGRGFPFAVYLRVGRWDWWIGDKLA